MGDEATPVRDLLMVLSTTGGRRPGERFALDRERVRIGRGSDNDLLLDSDIVGRRHAHLERRGEVWWIVDDGSANGTYVNDELIGRQHALRNNDRITIGNVRLAYLHGDDVERRYQDEMTRLLHFDPLTGVGNRRLLRDTTEREMELARQHDHDLCVALFDIDRFIHLNDQHGHIVGDLALKELARLLQAHLADAGVLARHAGGCFALLMPETSLDEAVALCDEARAAIARHTFDIQGETFSLTVSVGIRALSASDADVTSFFTRAEDACHEAKRAGRNCVRG